MNRFTKRILLIFGLVTVAAVATGASAATFRAGSEYTLANNSAVADNLYTAARDLTVAGNVEKDLLAAGASVVVQGRIGADAAVAGGTVDIRGPITGDARVAGGTVIVDGQIGGDLIVAGGTVMIRPSVRVAGDTVIFADHVVLDGTFERGVTIHARTIEVRGNVKGVFDGAVGESMVVHDTARLEKDVIYSARKPATISQGATLLGTTTFNQRENQQDARDVFLSVFGILGFIGFVSVLVSTALLAHFFPRFSKEIAVRAIESSKKSIAAGFVVSLALPVVTVLLLITIVGFALALIAGLSFVLLLIVGKLLSGIIAGALLSQWKTKELKVTWVWALLGALAAQLISIVPILGWFVMIMLFFVAAGALSTLLYEKWWLVRRETPSA